MLIKILINGILTTCAASVPVAAGTYVYLCSEEAKALSHESLSLKLLQKKPVPKVKPKRPSSPPPPPVAQGAKSTKGSSSVDGASSKSKSSGPDSDSGSSSSLSSPPSPASSIPASPTPTDSPDAVENLSPAKNSIGSSTAQKPNSNSHPTAPDALPTNTDQGSIKSTDIPKQKPAPSVPLSETPSQGSVGTNSGTQGVQMTIEKLKTMINIDSTITQENKTKWMSVIEKLKSLSDTEKNSLLSRFQII